ncbi:MAG TPA: HAD family phosphatase [Verrucomicrobiae bacterium]|jgi:HAD superfamily hydrolase (TIGR01509 family)|nr:HAD family phosphatase [Verrucomicrobiae bacterium]
MNYKAVLFDMDGVIVDSEPLHVAAFQATLKNYGYSLSDEQYKQHFAGKTDEAGFKQYFDFIGETVDLPVIMDKKATAYLELAADRLVPYPVVIDFIKSLAEQGTPLALVTGSLRAEAEVTLKTFGLTDFFSSIIAAEDISQSKPSPEGYLKGARALRAMPSDCIVIEDAPSGVKAARAAGMRCLAVTTTHTKEELREATAITDRLRPGCIDSL